MNRSARIEGLDAIRGIAAIGVVAFHGAAYRGWPAPDWIGSRGYFLVDLFFVLSGYLFSTLYARELPPWRTFAARRIARLYPLHLVAWSATAIAFLLVPPLEGEPGALQFIIGLAMIAPPPHFASFNIPAWSVTVEVVCYAAFYLLLRLKHLNLAPYIVALSLVGASLTGTEIWHLLRGPLGFFAGCILLRLSPPSWAGWLMIAVGIAAGEFLDPKIPIYSITLWPGVIVVALGTRALRASPLVWAGDHSYAIYLLHYPLLALVSKPILFWLLLLIFAVGARRFIELPAQRAMLGGFEAFEEYQRRGRVIEVHAKAERIDGA